MRKLILFTATLLLLASCYRKPLYDECICSESAALPISIDWDPSEVVPQNVSVLVYDSETGDLYTEHYYEDNDDAIQSYVYLPLGNYTAVVFNEKPNQIDYVSVDGYDNLETLRFFANNDSKVKARVRSTDSVDDYIQQPGALAVQVIEDIEVTAELITYTYSYSGSDSSTTSTKASEETIYQSEKLMGLIPTRKTSTMDIVVNVTNISMASMPALADLRNIADGYWVATDRNTTDAATVQFDLNNRTYNEGSTTDGRISATISLFGSLGDRMSTVDHTDLTPMELDILFTLLDEEATELDRVSDITSLVNFTDNSYIGIYLDVETEIEGLPTIIISDDGGSGLGAAVEEWESAVETTITFN